jgi:hypothetical protein
VRLPARYERAGLLSGTSSSQGYGATGSPKNEANCALVTAKDLRVHDQAPRVNYVHMAWHFLAEFDWTVFVQPVLLNSRNDFSPECGKSMTWVELIEHANFE